MISEWGGWAGTGAVWLVACGLMLTGLAGCVLPALPGPLLILLTALGHRLLLGEASSGVGWWSLGGLAALALVAQLFDWFSGALGAKWFGGSGWGVAGALIGGLVGMFFLPFGLLLGPLLGAMALEFLMTRKKARPAVVAGMGAAAGTLAGMAARLGVGLAMIAWWLADVFFW